MSAGAAGSCEQRSPEAGEPGGRARHGRVRERGDRLAAAVDPEARALDERRRRRAPHGDRREHGPRRPARERGADPRRAARGEQRQRERRQRVQARRARGCPASPARPRRAAGRAGSGPAPCCWKPSDSTASAERRDAEPDPQRPRPAAPAEPAIASSSTTRPGNSVCSGTAREPVAHAAVAPPHTRLVPGRRRNMPRPPSSATVTAERLASGWCVEDAHVRAREHAETASSSSPATVAATHPRAAAPGARPAATRRRRRRRARPAGRAAAGRG